MNGSSKKVDSCFPFQGNGLTVGSDGSFEAGCPKAEIDRSIRITEKVGGGDFTGLHRRQQGSNLILYCVSHPINFLRPYNFGAGCLSLLKLPKGIVNCIESDNILYIQGWVYLACFLCLL